MQGHVLQLHLELEKIDVNAKDAERRAQHAIEKVEGERSMRKSGCKGGAGGEGEEVQDEPKDFRFMVKKITVYSPTRIDRTWIPRNHVVLEHI